MMAFMPIRIENRDFFIEESYVKIRIIRKNGSEFYTLVDLEDWPRIRCNALSIMPYKNGYRVRIVLTNSKVDYLHRYLLSAPDDLLVDHRDGNGLNNRRHNLRLATQAENLQNRHSSHSNTGIRNVYETPSGTFRTQVVIAGKQHCLGHFTEIADAEAKVSSFRAQYMPFSNDAQEAHNG